MNSETTPIWRDTYYTGATDTIDYYIECEGAVIYRGKAYIMPNRNNVNINVAKICKDYLSNALENGEWILAEDGEIMGSFEAVKEFNLYDSEGTLLDTYHFRYDWSYGDVTIDENEVLTKPINGHLDPRMVGIVTQLVEDEYYKTYKDNATYSVSACGDYALYYLQRNGGYASFLIEGNVKRSDAYDRYTYNMALDNTKATFEESIYNNHIKTSWELHTGWLTDEQSENLAFNLLSTNRCFLHELKTDRIIPVLIDNSNADFKTFKNNGRKMVNYTINLTESQGKQYL